MTPSDCLAQESSSYVAYATSHCC